MTARLKRLYKEANRFTTTDRRFFNRFPERSYRIRRSCAAEIEAIGIFNKTSMALAPGRRWFTAVRQVSPGERLRVFLSGRADFDTDVDDDTARDLWRIGWSNSPEALAAFERALAEGGAR